MTAVLDIAGSRTEAIGEELHALAAELFPITRSIAGPGFRATLEGLERVAGPMERHRFATGTRVCDWTIPREWRIRDAWIRDPAGNRVVSLADSNLHVVSHSIPVHRRISLSELQQHLHSLPGQPDAIPYRTSYYDESWGFCLSDRRRRELIPGEYEVLIDSELVDGRVELGEIVVPGRSTEEILFSTYCCHPSMANNELSGPVVVAALARMLRELEQPPRLTYRFLFVPETIGSIAYLSRFGERLMERLRAGYVITCVGSPQPLTYKNSRRGGTLADRVALHVLEHTEPAHRQMDYYPPRSDERQYCSPGFNLPVGVLMRGWYDEWPEYHTSLDDLSFVTAQSLGASFEACRRMIDALEANETLTPAVPFGEPQLARRGLYPRTGGGWQFEQQRRQLEDMMFLLHFCDGEADLLAAAERSGRSIAALHETADRLVAEGLLHSAADGTPPAMPS
jgi:aminopeptidase-like protein